MKNLRVPLCILTAIYVLFLLGGCGKATVVTAAVKKESEAGWLTNYEQGQRKAKADHKLVLLNFTGSDWCGWCIKLDNEVFSKPAFKNYAEKNLVLVEVDFPRNKPMTDEVKNQNAQLAQQYQIQGFPTIMVLNGEGKPVGALGYTQGGPDAFIAELEKLRKG